MTAQEALNHPWLSNVTVPEMEIDRTKLKKYVIRRRWKKAINTIIAIKRMGAGLDIHLV